MKPLIESKTVTQVALDCTLVLPDGWELVMMNCNIDTERRTITPQGDQSVFMIRRKSAKVCMGQASL